MIPNENTVKDRLEPEVADLPISLAVSASCAISMKRIADEIVGSREKYGLVDGVSNAIIAALQNR